MIPKRYLINAIGIGICLEACALASTTTIFTLGLVGLGLNLFVVMKGLGWLDSTR